MVLLVGLATLFKPIEHFIPTTDWNARGCMLLLEYCLYEFSLSPGIAKVDALKGLPT